MIKRHWLFVVSSLYSPLLQGSDSDDPYRFLPLPKLQYESLPPCSELVSSIENPYPPLFFLDSSTYPPLPSSLDYPSFQVIPLNLSMSATFFLHPLPAQQPFELSIRQEIKQSRAPQISPITPSNEQTGEKRQHAQVRQEYLKLSGKNMQDIDTLSFHDQKIDKLEGKISEYVELNKKKGELSFNERKIFKDLIYNYIIKKDILYYFKTASCIQVRGTKRAFDHIKERFNFLTPLSYESYVRNRFKDEHPYMP